MPWTRPGPPVPRTWHGRQGVSRPRACACIPATRAPTAPYGPAGVAGTLAHTHRPSKSVSQGGGNAERMDRWLPSSGRASWWWGWALPDWRWRSPWPGRRWRSPSSIAATTICSSPCSIRWRRPPCRRPTSPGRSARSSTPRPTHGSSSAAPRPVDQEGRTVVLDDDRRVAYDHLVLATGARHSYFGHDAWEEVAPGLKKIDDATLIRQRVLLGFERAEVGRGRRRAHPAAHLCRHRRWCHGRSRWLVPSPSSAAWRWPRTFAAINPQDTRIILIEAGSRLLSSFAPSLSAKAKAALERLGVEVRLGQRVTACDADGVIVDGERIAARTIV